MLSNNQKVPIRRIKRLVSHILPRRVEKDPQTLLHGRVPRPSHQMETMNPVNCIVQIKGVPSKLVGNMMQLGRLRGHARVIGICIFRDKVPMRGCGEDTVHPGLLVFVSGNCEGCSGEFFCVETVWGLLWGVLGDGESAFDSFGSAWC